MAEIRGMTEEEVVKLVEWAGEEGWNPGRRDGEVFWRLDREGFLALVEGEVMVGGGALVKYGGKFGFMGLFIVRKSHRGRKLGTKLWYARRDRLRGRLEEGGTIGLDGVDAMVGFYEKGGFVPYTRHRRFMVENGAEGCRRAGNVVELKEVGWSQVLEYDRRCFPAEREGFLRDWVQQEGAAALGVVEGGKLLGFGVMRQCITGWKVGPLFADSGEAADALLQAFRRESVGGPVFLDAPDDNPQAMALCRKHGMQEVFGCVRMYLGPPPTVDHGRIFGITTLEVG